MKLAGFRLYRYHLPLAESPKLKGTTLRHREGLLVELTGDGGAVGWGEASPLPGFSRESLDEAARQMRDLASSMVGREVTGDWIDTNGDFSRELDAMDLAPSVRFGFELAVWNLYAASRGKSLPELVAPQPRATVPVNALISPDEALEEARRARAAGTGDREVPAGLDTYRRLAEDVLRPWTCRRRAWTFGR